MKYVLYNVNILDGSEDMKPFHGAVLVEDGRIKGLADSTFELVGAKRIDLGGRYLMPGLINMHVHLPGSGMPSYTKKQNAKSVRLLMGNPITRTVVYFLCQHFARTELMSGVTTIRTVGGLGRIDSRIRDNTAKGFGKAPRILASNLAVSVPGGHMAGVLAYEAKTPEDCVNFVDKIAEDNPDLIKLMITGGVLDAEKLGEPGVLRMPPELVKAACDEAHKLGYKVAAHVESPEGMRVALENGVDTIEHGAELDEELLRLFKERSAAHICTISPAIPCSLFDLDVTHSTDFIHQNSLVVMNGMIACANAALKNGIPVGLGTDTASPFVTHYDMWRELVYFAKYTGVSNAFALHTATAINARIAGIENETGTVSVGKSADFLICDGNPLDDLQALRKPYMVVMRGKMIKQPKVKKFEYVEKELDKYM